MDDDVMSKRPISDAAIGRARMTGQWLLPPPLNRRRSIRSHSIQFNASSASQVKRQDGNPNDETPMTHKGPNVEDPPWRAE